MNLDIDALRSFAAVAEHRNFTRAASVVARTQSAVSVQIRKLEVRLGFDLFERSKRSVALTTRGETLLAYAHHILRINDEGVRAVTAASLQGRLRLGLTEYFAPQHMPAIVQAFRAAHPTLELELSTGVTGHLLGLQKAGALDIVIGRRSLGSSAGELIRRERLAWVAASSFRLRSHEAVPLALLPVGCGVRSLALASLKQAKRPWRAAYCGPSVLGLQAAVAAGLAASCLTQSACLPGFRSLGAREGLPRLPDSEIALFVARRGASSLVLEMAEVVRQYFASPVNAPGLLTAGS
jgi:DNA-binding transcriptional LysR family regulator